MAAPRHFVAAGLFGFLIQARWRPTGDPWALFAAMGTDLIAGAPTFGYTQSGRFVSVFTPSILEPRALVGIEVAQALF
jgi:hypothetical protein